MARNRSNRHARYRQSISSAIATGQQPGARGSEDINCQLCALRTSCSDDTAIVDSTL